MKIKKQEESRETPLSCFTMCSCSCLKSLCGWAVAAILNCLVFRASSFSVSPHFTFIFISSSWLCIIVFTTIAKVNMAFLLLGPLEENKSSPLAAFSRDLTLSIRSRSRIGGCLVFLAIAMASLSLHVKKNKILPQWTMPPKPTEGSRIRHINRKVWHLDVGSSPLGTVVCSKGWVVLARLRAKFASRFWILL